MPLIEAKEGHDVRPAVPEFGVEAGDGFGGVVGSYHQQVTFTGDRVLGDHAGPGLDVAPVEV